MNLVASTDNNATNTLVRIDVIQPEWPVRITLPWKALAADNERHALLRTKGGGRRIGLTETYRTALYAASLMAKQQWGHRPALKDRVVVTVTLHEPDKRRRDVSNYLKLTMDALTRIAFVDDSQIDKLIVVRGALDRTTPRAVITIQPSGIDRP